METNEIVKALRVCGGTGRCVECPLGDKLSGCMKSVMTEAAGLIERQDVEVRALRGAAGSLKAALEDAQKSIEVFGQANAALREKVPEWIPVTEKIPPDQEEVLVLTRSKNGVRNIDKGYWAIDHFIHRGRSAVTHWMPLPELPEELK